MSPTHVFFIPAILLLGLAIGYQLGARAVRNELAKKRERMKE